MPAGYFLDGSMVERTSSRSIDERGETRQQAASSTAVLEFRGRRHVVRLGNLSASGAMVIFSHAPNIGEHLKLQLLDHGTVSAQVRWVRDGKIGLSFTSLVD